MSADTVVFRPLTPLQARVVAVLLEKEKTVPDVYPMSVNALTAGCNQRNNRDPVMDATEVDVNEALAALQARSMAIATSGARVTRYEQNLARVLRVPEQAAALLATLMLRGPQTAAELRANAERLHRFADTGSVEAFLDELARRPAERGGPLVVLLPRGSGAREPRWAHLLCGPVAVEVSAAAEPPRERGRSADADGLAALRDVVAQLTDEMAALRRRVDLLETRAPETRAPEAGSAGTGDAEAGAAR
jgi:hypothetical protein